jgi:RimJ/RimL family protein N-acetyltransferase
MDSREFAAVHMPALEAAEARHNLILAMTARAIEESSDRLRIWSLGGPGACAAQAPDRPIVLGELDKAQCAQLAQEVDALPYPGVVGPGETAIWFVEAAQKAGRSFLAPMPQKIHEIRRAPHYPTRVGSARTVTTADADLFTAWVVAFSQEATPHDPAPKAEELGKAASSGRYMFWTAEDAPVSLAGVVRRTRNGIAIASVYTPPDLRGRGYAGAVTAALVDRARAEGKQFACLYTDLRNPFSNRCYARVGFEPVCDSWFFPVAPSD